MRAYLASPLGFSEAGRHWHDGVLVPALEALGVAVLNPWKLTDAAAIQAVQALPYGAGKRDAWRALNRRIGRANLEAIRACDCLVAVLDGADVDSGTAAEIGCAFALGKPCFGYRGDFRLAADNHGSVVNLQVEFFITESGGGAIATSLEELTGAVASWLEAAAPDWAAAVSDVPPARSTLQRRSASN
jgi:nucleoside 2-deoxyribosyltransferase